MGGPTQETSGEPPDESMFDTRGKPSDSTHMGTDYEPVLDKNKHPNNKPL